jgi:hypothetical protein
MTAVGRGKDLDFKMLDEHILVLAQHVLFDPIREKMQRARSCGRNRLRQIGREGPQQNYKVEARRQL